MPTVNQNRSGYPGHVRSPGSPLQANAATSEFLSSPILTPPHGGSDGWEDLGSAIELQDDRETQFLNVVDDIRSHDLNRELSLPQLVVCGSQSSGKSSVLEAITRVPFPRGDTTCTRFVTEIRLLRDNVRSVNVSIIPDSSRSPANQAALSGFNMSRPSHRLEELMKEASRAMGFTDNPASSGLKFSKDILRVEIRGPTNQRLTIVDLPGLIQVDRRDRDGEVLMVDELTDRYIQDPQSIILAILNADDNFQKHRILQKARDVDPEGRRTFGIITKPDRTEPGMDNEAEWIRIVQGRNEDVQFQQGCHVLVNRTAIEVVSNTSSEERDRKEEAFFKEERYSQGEHAGKPNRWHVLHRVDRWGVKHLRNRLKTVLFKHTLDQMPRLKKDIKQKLAGYDDELKAVSNGLKDPHEMKRILSDISMEMSIITEHGAKGTYNEHEFFQLSEAERGRYLRAKIRSEERNFFDELKQHGHNMEYAWTPNGIVPSDGTEWVQKFYDVLVKTQGAELPGYFDPQRINLLFVDYSNPWKDIAEDYVERAFEHCRTFLLEVLAFKLNSQFPALSSRFWAHVLEDRLDERKGCAVEELGKLEVDRLGTVITENERFWQESSRTYASRMFRKINTAQDLIPTEEHEPALSIIGNTPELTAQALGMGDEESLRRDTAVKMIQDMLIYYNISRDRFIDNVLIQVVERHLLVGLRKVFQLDWIDDDALFEQVYHDPDHETNLRKKRILGERRKNLRNCLASFEGDPFHLALFGMYSGCLFRVSVWRLRHQGVEILCFPTTHTIVGLDFPLSKMHQGMNFFAISINIMGKKDKKKCTNPESNRGRVDGNDTFYH
ncbi:hypothetical protein P152DRAFT_511593 [Eremomyces bilateralis CBS 781.70]|uniref:Dynamin family protein n=1 Tax=Eremomyces bilateralis CBS 781.70 TaxID=1392243 RepID=A0A6G1GBT3_9PEZI|nr:uncharacterized protein P152DRAFT_511593 [Eremomyces bilateralis CBS 781.70]KAF1815442.1 hypothetical protein P152DRAFT_511593 [Eremomyces bilateralis CBS 781.70]